MPSAQYIYLVNGKWTRNNAVPSCYSGFDLYSAYKVVMNTPKPYVQHQSHITKYSKYKTYQSKQPVIRDSHDAKYTQARNNQGHNQPQGSHGQPQQHTPEKPENKRDNQHQAPSQKDNKDDKKGHSDKH